MPISKHYKGHGKEVMKDMRARYGNEKGIEVFYARENKLKSMKKGSTRMVTSESE
jgi:hypothetical protein